MFNHSSASASTPAPEFFSLEPATTTPGTPVSGAPNSVIVRTPQELGGAGGFPHTPQWSATGTPTGYSYNFPFFFPPTDFNFFPPSSTDSCSTGTSNLQSPILQGAGALDLHGGLNPLNRFPNYGRGVGLPYSDLSGPLMGTQKVHKGGRRPREEMTRNGELDDPEEAEKKLKRRQRNKEAAARCRQRRLDLMETLQGQVDRLKGENDGKEREIRNMSDKLNRLVDFIRKHQCNLSNDDMSSLESILSSAGSGGYSNNNVNNVAPQQQHYDRGSVSSTSSVSIASDYQPQNSNPPVSRAPLGPPAHPPAERKRPFVTSMPPTSANEDLEEPEIKVPKIENDQLIGGTNLARPTNLMGMNFSSVMNASVPITTPSRDLLSSAMHGGTPAFNLDSFGREGLLGNQSTGLTPSGAPQINFVIQTPTPLAQDGEYRSL